VAGGDGLAGRGVGPEPGPAALGLVLLVGDRALDHQHEGGELALGGAAEVAQELVAGLVGQDRVVQPDERQSWESAAYEVLEAGLSRGGDGDGVAIAA